MRVDNLDSGGQHRFDFIPKSLRLSGNVTSFKIHIFFVSGVNSVVTNSDWDE